jgi:hypothetical protein
MRSEKKQLVISSCVLFEARFCLWAVLITINKNFINMNLN